MKTDNVIPQLIDTLDSSFNDDTPFTSNHAKIHSRMLDGVQEGRMQFPWRVHILPALFSFSSAIFLSQSLSIT
jgi:hypothetical protein